MSVTHATLITMASQQRAYFDRLINEREAAGRWPSLSKTDQNAMYNELIKNAEPSFVLAMYDGDDAAVDDHMRALALIEIYADLVESGKGLGKDELAILREYEQAWSQGGTSADAVAVNEREARELYDNLLALHENHQTRFGVSRIVDVLPKPSPVSKPVKVSQPSPYDIVVLEQLDTKLRTPNLKNFAKRITEYLENPNYAKVPFLLAASYLYNKGITRATREAIKNLSPHVAEILEKRTIEELAHEAFKWATDFSVIVRAIGLWKSKLRPSLYINAEEFIENDLLGILALFGCYSIQFDNPELLINLRAIKKTIDSITETDSTLGDLHAICSTDGSKDVIKSVRSSWISSKNYIPDLSKYTWAEIATTHGDMPVTGDTQVPSICNAESFGYGFNLENIHAMLMSLALGIVEGFEKANGTINPNVAIAAPFDGGCGVFLLQAIYALHSGDAIDVMASKINSFTLKELVATVAKNATKAPAGWKNILNDAFSLSAYLRAMALYKPLARYGQRRVKLRYKTWGEDNEVEFDLPGAATLSGNPASDWGITNQDNINTPNHFTLAVGYILKFSEDHYGAPAGVNYDYSRKLFKTYDVIYAMKPDNVVLDKNEQIPGKRKVIDNINLDTLTQIEPVEHDHPAAVVKQSVADTPIPNQHAASHTVVQVHKPESEPDALETPVPTSSAGYIRQISRKVETDAATRDNIRIQWETLNQDPIGNFEKMVDFAYTHTKTLMAMKMQVSTPINNTYKAMKNSSEVTPDRLSRAQVQFAKFAQSWRDFKANSS